MSDPKITADLVSRLIADQFPQWADLPVRMVAKSGWDNRTFHLGDKMSVRLPSAARYAAQVEKEQMWLPKLAAHLPLPIPKPIAMGCATDDYPFAWSIMQWLPGTPADDAGKSNVAADLADFLRALQAVDTRDGPLPGPHNFHRGGDLRIYDQEVRHALAQLGNRVDSDQIMRLWTKACHSSWTAAPVWLHGDMAAGNILLAKGKLSAIIDFGNCGIGDPACDLTIAWTYFDAPTRQIFRKKVGLDDATCTRAKGWGLWKALLLMCQGEPAAQNTIQTILSEAG